jgi:hypothetical protein
MSSALNYVVDMPKYRTYYQYHFRDQIMSIDGAATSTIAYAP